MKIIPINMAGANYLYSQKNITAFKGNYGGIEDSLDDYDMKRGQSATEAEIRKEMLSRDAHAQLMNGDMKGAFKTKGKILMQCAEEGKWSDVFKLAKGMAKIAKKF